MSDPQQTTTTANGEGGEADAQYELEEGEAEEMYPTVPCPCGCHETTPEREGRPWLSFSNASYLVCPLCWVDAYMHASGSENRGAECDKYLREQGKDPKVPAAEQC
ncbi:hypothetical protein F4779DRAFT_615175 [Xylariaceae sp. FL0662B]|nr:hypothetical protein F4779DRAFT_615175 [Xylariaceae sp. FL0662B]